MPLSKRQFLSLGCGAVCVGVAHASGYASSRVNVFEEDGVHFEWFHTATALRCRLVAPTLGWLAIGFNSKSTLFETRFLMAVTSQPAISSQERLALAPPGTNVGELGLSEVFTVEGGRSTGGKSELEISLPLVVRERPGLDLGPDASVYLMLAWSTHAEFDHHSAWRRHYQIKL
ncbi:MAG: hypothetical protein AAF141_05390 [Pseudomonadota bacterium]